MRSTYFLINKVYLSEEVQEHCIHSENKSDNKVLIFECASQKFALKEEISKPVSDSMAYCGIFIS